MTDEQRAEKSLKLNYDKNHNLLEKRVKVTISWMGHKATKRFNIFCFKRKIKARLYYSVPIVLTGRVKGWKKPNQPV